MAERLGLVRRKYALLVQYLVISLSVSTRKKVKTADYPTIHYPLVFVAYRNL